MDAGFDFSECAETDFCSSSCTIAAGAQKLAQYIANANPPGDVILIGFSMGGLIARDMMANGHLLLNGRKISALITLGTPNLGYPYTLMDTAWFCTPLVQEMDGNWRYSTVNEYRRTVTVPFFANESVAVELVSWNHRALVGGVRSVVLESDTNHQHYHGMPRSKPIQ